MGTRSTSRGGSAKRSSSRSTAKKKRAAPAKGRGGGWIAERRHELLGLVLVVVAVIALLGTLGDLTGPVGNGLDTATGVVLGRLRLALPVIGLAGGVALILRRDEDRWADRAIVGGLVLVVAAAVALQLLSGPDEVLADADALKDGGGVVGSALGHPLERFLAVGAWVVVVALAVVGALVIVDRPAGDLLRSLGTGLAAVGGWVRHRVDRLGDLDGDGGVAATADDGRMPFDQDALPDITPPPPPRPTPEPEPEPEPAPEPQLVLPEPPPEVDLASLERRPAAGEWRLPPLTLLRRGDDGAIDEAAVREGARVLQEALASHGVATRVVGMTVGPTVTRYELELAPGVKVARVTSLSKDIAYAMASADVRILAPIPGRSAIGVEVPNRSRQLVTVGDVLSSTEAQQADHPLQVAIGRDIAGRSVMENLATMPHLLIAGATGAGKSSCINSMLASLLMRTTPEQVRLILVDPKMVELGQYRRVPHLLTDVVTDPRKAANALAWACREMDRRYEVLSAVGVRDITGFNEAVASGQLAAEHPGEGEPEPLPYIVIVVDELNDLMMVAARDVEASITRIAQKARAVGIHLVVATQRPSVNVITGVIKANIPARLAFAVSSLADSRVILDQPGAERLVGKGDMLLLGPSSSIAHRIQGCWVEEGEIREMVAAWRRQAPEVRYVEGVEGEAAEGEDPVVEAPPATSDDDDLVARAIDLVVRSQLGSTSMLQRKLRVGFARAGRLMDELEQRGVVGPSEGSKARAVLMTVAELEELQAAGRV